MFLTFFDVVVKDVYTIPCRDVYTSGILCCKSGNIQFRYKYLYIALMCSTQVNSPMISHHQHVITTPENVTFVVFSSQPEA